VTTALDFVVAIPARYGSSRLPGKPLADIGGEPMIVHVARRAREAGASSVVVATDDARIADAVAALGLRARMTAADHVSGTDRLAECARLEGWSDEQIVVNLQGDEPLAPPEAIRAVAECLHASGAPIATLAVPLESADALFDPSCVKLVRNAAGDALYFSRAAIPWDRDRFVANRLQLRGNHWLRHVGLYAYRVGALHRFAGMPPGALEQVESLEQLRALEAGWRIAVAISPVTIPAGVDTPADLERVRAIIVQR
jgi:3-deoxy-manno-octulosonate cytidylyltransferase (CMP-KDO synthetase)